MTSTCCAPRAGRFPRDLVAALLSIDGHASRSPDRALAGLELGVKEAFGKNVERGGRGPRHAETAPASCCLEPIKKHLSNRAYRVATRRRSRHVHRTMNALHSSSVGTRLSPLLISHHDR